MRDAEPELTACADAAAIAPLDLLKLLAARTEQLVPQDMFHVLCLKFTVAQLVEHAARVGLSDQLLCLRHRLGGRLRRRGACNSAVLGRLRRGRRLLGGRPLVLSRLLRRLLGGRLSRLRRLRCLRRRGAVNSVLLRRRGAVNTGLLVLSRLLKRRGAVDSAFSGCMDSGNHLSKLI